MTVAWKMPKKQRVSRIVLERRRKEAEKGSTQRGNEIRKRKFKIDKNLGGTEKYHIRASKTSTTI